MPDNHDSGYHLLFSHPEMHTPLRHYQPTLRYYLLDESRYPQGKPGSLVGFLFQIENCTKLEDLLLIVTHWNEHGRTTVPASLRRTLGRSLSHILCFATLVHPCTALDHPRDQPTPVSFDL